jgi:hypothetical protein
MSIDKPRVSLVVQATIIIYLVVVWACLGLIVLFDPYIPWEVRGILISFLVFLVILITLIGVDYGRGKKGRRSILE